MTVLCGNRQSLAIVILFCLFWGWDWISCNWVWGLGIAHSHSLRATICHYTICRCCFRQTGSLLKREEDLASVFHQSGSEEKTDGIGQIRGGVVLSDSWGVSIPSSSEEGARTLGQLASHYSAWEIYRTKNIVILVFLLPLVFLLKQMHPCVPITQAALWISLQDFHDFPSLSSSGSSWCCWIAHCSTILRESIVMEVGPTARESILTLFSSLPVLTPQLSLHDEPWHRWI